MSLILVSSVSLPRSSMSTNSSYPLLGFPTELIIRIFTYLQVTDLLSVQHSCRRFYDVISDSASLQYILHTEINLLKDPLPPDFSLNDRVALLKHHETAWNNLELNMSARFVTTSEDHKSHSHCYLLQDGFLIYKAVKTARYGYLDLYSSSAMPNAAEAPWTHISLAALRPLSDIVFAVDHNLAVAIRSGLHGLPVAVFLEFTTGAPHPLSLAPPVSLPKEPDVNVLGDYILVTAEYGSRGRSIFSALSWKTGTYTQLDNQVRMLKVVVIDPDNNLVALMKSATNRIQICKLQFVSERPHLHALCSLKFPGSMHTIPPSVFMSTMEWVPTSKLQDRTEPPTSRRRPLPFRSYRAGSIGLILNFGTLDTGFHRYAMFISVEALLSAVHSGVSHVPWADWGPAGTRIFPFGGDIEVVRPAGPFWITSYAPLVVRDYNYLRAQYMKMTKEPMSSVPPNPGLSLGPLSTKIFGEHWEGGEVNTHLPFREFVAASLSLGRVVQVVADREWFVVISDERGGTRFSITVYHVG